MVVYHNAAIGIGDVLPEIDGDIGLVDKENIVGVFHFAWHSLY